MKAEQTLQVLESEGAKKLMEELYGKDGAAANAERYRDMIEKFKKTFGDKDILMFSSPGRTEISGNHTDHNHGKVLAGSINLDCVGIAAKNNSSKVNVISETFNQKFTIDLNNLAPSEKKAGTIDLVKGLPGLHHIAFGKQAFLDDAAHLRANFGAERGGGAAGELADYRHRLALQGDHAHFRRGLLRSRCLRIIASAKEK